MSRRCVRPRPHTLKISARPLRRRWVTRLRRWSSRIVSLIHHVYFPTWLHAHALTAMDAPRPFWTCRGPLQCILTRSDMYCDPYNTPLHPDHAPLPSRPPLDAPCPVPRAPAAFDVPSCCRHNDATPCHPTTLSRSNCDMYGILYRISFL